MVRIKPRDRVYHCIRHSKARFGPERPSGAASEREQSRASPKREARGDTEIDSLQPLLSTKSLQFPVVQSETKQYPLSVPVPTTTMTRPKSDRRRSSASTRSLSALSYDLSDAVDQVKYEEANQKSIGQRVKSILSRSVLSRATRVRSRGHPAPFRPATIKPIGRTRMLDQWDERSDEQSSTKSSSLLRQSHQTEPIYMSSSTSASFAVIEQSEVKVTSHEDLSALIASSVGVCEAHESSVGRDCGTRRTASRRNSRMWQAGTDMMSGHEDIEGDRHRTTPQHEDVRPRRQCHEVDELRTSKEEEVRDGYMEDYLKSCLEDNLDMMIEFDHQDAVSLDCCGSLEDSDCHTETSEFGQSSQDRPIKKADDFDLLMEEYAAMLGESDFNLLEPITEIPIKDILLRSLRSSTMSDVSLNSYGLDSP